MLISRSTYRGDSLLGRLALYALLPSWGHKMASSRSCWLPMNNSQYVSICVHAQSYAYCWMHIDWTCSCFTMLVSANWFKAGEEIIQSDGANPAAIATVLRADKMKDAWHVLALLGPNGFVQSTFFWPLPLASPRYSPRWAQNVFHKMQTNFQWTCGIQILSMHRKQKTNMPRSAWCPRAASVSKVKQ